MLTMLDKSEVPGYRDVDKSPLRRFSAQTAREFLEITEIGDVAEVEDAPVDMDATGVQKLSQAIRTELFHMKADEDMRNHVRVFTRRKSRVFLERIEPWEVRRLRLNSHQDC